MKEISADGFVEEAHVRSRLRRPTAPAGALSQATTTIPLKQFDDLRQLPGIGLAVVLAVIEFLWDGWRPHSAVLGRALAPSAANSASGSVGEAEGFGIKGDGSGEIRDVDVDQQIHASERTTTSIQGGHRTHQRRGPGDWPPAPLFAVLGDLCAPGRVSLTGGGGRSRPP